MLCVQGRVGNVAERSASRVGDRLLALQVAANGTSLGSTTHVRNQYVHVTPYISAQRMFDPSVTNIHACDIGRCEPNVSTRTLVK